MGVKKMISGKELEMKKFKKLVAAAPVNLVGWAREELKEYAKEVVLYT